MSGLSVTFDAAYYTDAVFDSGSTGSGGGSSSPPSGATSPDVPAVWDVAVAGHGYMLDFNPQAGFRHESIPTLRPVFIEGDTLGEKDINPESLWRFSDRDWSHGAGQRRADLPSSDTSMFWASKGVDPWTEWQISLLPDTTQVIGVAGGDRPHVLAVSDYLYVIVAGTVRMTTDLTSFTTVTGLGAVTVTGMATDGHDIYFSTAANGIWTTTKGAASASQLVTGTDAFTALSYVNGRLMAAVGPSIYNITSATPAALPTALFTHPNTDFVWVGFAEGQSAIYAAGRSGDVSQVYRIGIDTAGVNLTVPILAAPSLLRGETILAIGSYLGFIFIGSATGIRMCVADGNGNLSVGAQILTGPCRCFTGYGRWVWFGWDNYDTQSTGLGRLDITIETSSGAPAYASDLMVTGQANVIDVTSFNGKRVLAVEGQGVYVESVNRVTEGHLDSGLVTYDIADPKIAMYLTVRHGDLNGTQAAWLSVDESPFILIGVHDSTSTTTTFTIPELEGESFEVREVLTRDLVTPSLSPTVTRQTLLSLPNVDSGVYFYVPVIIAELNATRAGERSMDVTAEREFLYALRQTSQRVIYQELSSSWPVTVDDFTWTPTHINTDNTGMNGTLLLKLKSI